MTVLDEQDVERLARFFELSSELLCVRDLDGRIEKVNPAWQACLGYSCEEIEGRGLLSLVHPEDLKATQAQMRSVDQADSSAEDFVNRYRHKDGSYRHLEWRARKIDGLVYGLARDITGRVAEIVQAQAERDALDREQAEVQAALAAAQAILDNSHDIICSVSRKGRILRINRRAEELLGYSSDELFSAEFLSIIHPDDRAAAFQRAIEIMGGSPGGGLLSRCMSKSGVAIPMMWSATWSKSHETMFAVAHDLREQTAAEERLRQAQKMEAVGRLTGGVAHDFNNLLTVIIGSAEAMAEAAKDRPDILVQAKLALDAADRGAELVTRLLAFSRNQPLMAQALDCNEVLDSVRQMVRRTFAEDIEIVLEKGPENLRCMADRTQLTTALLNLCINARDAMPDGGQLILRAAAEALPREDKSGTKSFVVLTVEDNGSGMSEDTREHAAEPFFTTKSVGDGSGLGLSMVYGFVSQSGGSLQIDSALGIGTRIRLYLPTTQARLVSEPLPTEPSAAPASGRILVVEDDDLIRSQVERQLRALGHHVTLASNGVEALALLGKTKEFDLLLTDVVMPKGINGRELAERTRSIAPRMRILLTSGHNEDAFLRGNAGHGGDDFLSKPYRRRELEEKISRLLRSAE